jgi:hypothetical protein
MRRRIVPVAVLLAAVFGPSALAQSDPRALELYEKKIRPVLAEHCSRCHSAEAAKNHKLKGGLLVDDRDGLLKGGDTGPAVVPGKAADSLLIQALHYDGDLRMPPRGKLPGAVIADFERWVNAGAAAPSVASRPGRGTSVVPAATFWAYQPVRAPAVPAVQDAAWPAGAIDRFVLAGLEARGLHPAADADRATLARRLYFDLVGLPPSPEEVDAFVNDPDPAAYEKLVERLLASPHFGERWGRHWLDVARFAESLTLRGFILKEAWRYRDYVIDAFDRDVPFDQFVREQLAGDLLPAATPADRRRQLVATAFLVLGNTNLEEQDKQQLRMDVVDEQLDVIGKGFLAQTITCARCHDHKFDPIPTTDYYALAGILRNAKALEHANVSKWLEVPLPLTAAEEADPKKPKPLAMSVVEEKQIEDAHVHVRGSVHSLGAVVPRGFLSAATRGTTAPLPAHESGRRQLAEWIASRDNPLTARVFVNRAWHWLFGAGLVRTTDNFGSTGELPSHPELLDHLATRFTEGGWSMKSLVRAVVLSRTYCQATTGSAAAAVADPENRLLARQNRRRLDAECLRDTMLAVSGRLTLDHGGPTFPPTLAADYHYQHTDMRRSVYSPVFRNALPELLAAFDFADPSMETGQRNVSTVAPQALLLLNSPFVVDQARAAAARLLATGPADDDGRVVWAYRLALGRAPTPGERRVALRFLGDRAGDPKKAWATLFQALFASVDFRYVE